VAETPAYRHTFVRLLGFLRPYRWSLLVSIVGAACAKDIPFEPWLVNECDADMNGWQTRGPKEAPGLGARNVRVRAWARGAPTRSCRRSPA